MDIRLQFWLIIAGSGALIGALLSPLVFWGKGRKPATGFFVGVFCGAAGNVLLLIPMWFLLKPRRSFDMGGFNIAVAYNMGVAAVMGGRREEARFYFTQVSQADPQNVTAWLYLANLATSPLEAWTFVQQARLADPSSPLVQEAVAVVWPQVQRYYAEQGEVPISPSALNTGYPT